MLDFVLIFITFVVASGCMSWVAYSAIQKDEVFGAWQKVLDKLYAKSEAIMLANKTDKPNNYTLAERFLGGCYKCFSHLWSLFGFGLYVVFHKYFLEYHYGYWYILLYIIFVPTAITVSMLINKLLEK